MKSTDRVHKLLSKLKKLVSPQHVTAVVFCALAIVCFSFVTTAKTTYVVSDGSDTVTLSTYADNTQAAIEEAGFSLSNGDRFSHDRFGNKVSVKIHRAAEVTVRCDNESNKYYTFKGTVGELMQDLGISVDQDDKMNFEMTDAIFDGMIIKISHVKTVSKTLQVPIAYETVREDDPYQTKGTETVATEGVNGKKEIQYELTYVNGVLSSSRIVGETVLAEPVNEVIQVGTKEPVSLSSTLASGGNTEDFSYSYCLNMTATAYSSQEPGLSAYTASGELAQVGIVAADFSVLPMGTHVYITAAGGSWTYGYAVVGDTGVSGDVIDLFFDTVDECYSFGVRDAIVYVLD